MEIKVANGLSAVVSLYRQGHFLGNYEMSETAPALFMLYVGHIEGGGMVTIGDTLTVDLFRAISHGLRPRMKPGAAKQKLDI